MRRNALCANHQDSKPSYLVQVLTDRAFLAEPKTMVKAFILGGIVAGTACPQHCKTHIYHPVSVNAGLHLHIGCQADGA